MDGLISTLIAQGGMPSVIAVLAGVVVKLWLDGKEKDSRIVSILTDWRSDTALSNEKLYSALETLKAVMAQGPRK